MTMNTTIFGAYTDRGGTRPENQDSVISRAIQGPAVPEKSRSPFAMLGRSKMKEKAAQQALSSTVILSVVCDGVGGLERGDLASGVVVGELDQWMGTMEGCVNTYRPEADVLFSHFKDAAEHCNAVLLETNKTYNIRSGTTFAGFLCVGAQYGIVHVGDSRVYRYRPTEGVGTKLLQLTEDESVYRVKDGRTRSYLENFVGRQEMLSFRFYSGTMEIGDMFFACSDGFYHNLTEQDVGEMYASIASGVSPEDAIAAVVRLMIERGERDNLSAALTIFGGCVAENTAGVAAAEADPDITMI